MVDEKILIELDGAGTEPSTVEARSLLDLASAFLDIVERLAEENGIEVSFTGLWIENKCAALATRLEPWDFAREAAVEALQLVGGLVPIRRGLDGPVQRARSAVMGLPQDVKAKVIVGPWEHPIATVMPLIEHLPEEVTEIRCIVVRIGGTRPSVRLHSASEANDFTLRAPPELCRKLGERLYKEIDVRADGGGRKAAGGQLPYFFTESGGSAAGGTLGAHR